MSDYPLTMIRDLVEVTAGINGHLLTDSQLITAVNDRMHANRMKVPFAYLTFIRQNPEELQELIEKLVVPETWFFRDKAAYDALIAKLSTQKTPFRLLSFPCSTGEEPYSIAMALFEAGYTPTHFVIDALEISRKSLKIAEDGVYGKNSFRGRDYFYRDTYFKETSIGEYTIGSMVRKPVRFFQGNLYAKNYLDQVNSHHYHAIFCRNCLIYLHPEAQAKVLSDFKRLLMPNGLLFVGAAETTLTTRHGFKLQHPYKAGALTPSASKPQETLKLELPVVPKREVVPVIIHEIAPQQFHGLDEAVNLANEGRFDEAFSCCTEYVTHNETDAEGYFLLGVLEQARDHLAQAEKLFQKAVYLNPNHHDALLYLSVLANQRHDSKQAELFLERAKRSS